MPGYTAVKKRSLFEALTSSIPSLKNPLEQLDLHKAQKWRNAAAEAAGQNGRSKNVTEFSTEAKEFLRGEFAIRAIKSKEKLSEREDRQLQQLTQEAYAFIRRFLTAHMPIGPLDSAAGAKAAPDYVYLQGLECMRVGCTGVKGAAPALDWTPAWTDRLVSALTRPLGQVVHDKVLDVLQDVLGSNKGLCWEDAFGSVAEGLMRLTCRRPAGSAQVAFRSLSQASAQFLQESHPGLLKEDVPAAMLLLIAMFELLAVGAPSKQSTHANMELLIAVSWKLVCMYPGQDGAHLANVAMMFEQVLQSPADASLVQPVRLVLVDFLLPKYCDDDGAEHFTSLWPMQQLHSLAALTEAICPHLPAGKTPYWSLWLPLQKAVCAQVRAELAAGDQQQGEDALCGAFALLEKSSHAWAQAHVLVTQDLPIHLQETLSQLEERYDSWGARVRSARESLQAIGVWASNKRRRLRDGEAWASTVKS